MPEGRDKSGDNLQCSDLISVIIPVYKVEKYLDRCLKSVTQQTYSNLEIILVDDGSPDRCPEMCDEWAKKDKRIRVIHKENGGLSSARNEGLRLASGDYIGFVDSDDWILDNMYENLYSLLKRTDSDISVCGIIRVSELFETKNHEQISEYCTYTQEEYLKKILKVKTQDSNHYVWNKLYKSSIIKSVRYPVGLIDEDVEGTFLAVLNASKIVETKEIGYVYWINNNSITTSDFNERQLDYLKICDHIIKISENRSSKEILGHAICFRYRADFGMLCKMAISRIDKKFDRKHYSKILLGAFRKHYKVLMKSSIPFDRKVLMTMMYVNYPITATMMKLIAVLMRKKLSKRV